MKRSLLLSMVQTDKIITNFDFPACRNCVYYQPSYYKSDFTSALNKCNKFGVKDIITDEITYNYADLCRNDETKCGKEGKYFLKETNIKMKVWKHSFISNLPRNIIWGVLFMSIIVNIRKALCF